MIIHPCRLLTRDDGIEIHWEERGSGPLVILAPYCISHPSVFDPLQAELEADHRLVRYDDRGSGASTRRGPYDMETGASDLEAVLEAAGGSAVVVALADCVNRAVRVAASRPDLVEALIVPGGNPAGRRSLEGTDAMVSSDSVVDAFISMAETDYRGAVRVAGDRRQPADERGRDPRAGQAPGRVSAAGSGRPAACGPGRRTMRASRGGSAATGCGCSIPTTRAGAGSRPANEGRQLARRLFPEAHVERIENGIMSRPDLTAAAVRRITSALRLESGA